MTALPPSPQRTSDQRLLRGIRAVLITLFGGATAFMAVVAFYSLIPQIFFAATPDTPYSPCAENEASDCRDMPCDARLSGLMGILLDHLSERSANPRAGEQSDFFRQWDASYRSLAPLCENENLSSYEALARLRYRVETDLVQLRERYLPILEHLPPRPIMRTADAAHQN